MEEKKDGNKIISEARYRLLDFRGKGSYGVVYSAMDCVTKEHVAIKKVADVFTDCSDAVRILRELILLRSLRQHPNIVELKNVFVPPGLKEDLKEVYMVFELADRTLHDAVRDFPELTPTHHKVVAYQLLRGLAFLHESGILHRDLKPANILVNANWSLKICDLGLARPTLFDVPCTSFCWTDYVSTRWYRAPELCGCFSAYYTSKVDMWSAGCIIAEMLLRGRPLFPGKDVIHQLTLITDMLGRPDDGALSDVIANPHARYFFQKLPRKESVPFETVFPCETDPQLLQVLKGLLALNPRERLSARQALQMPYFSEMPAVESYGMVYNPHEFWFDAVMPCTLSVLKIRELILAECLRYRT